MTFSCAFRLCAVCACNEMLCRSAIADGIEHCRQMGQCFDVPRFEIERLSVEVPCVGIATARTGNEPEQVERVRNGPVFEHARVREPLGAVEIA